MSDQALEQSDAAIDRLADLLGTEDGIENDRLDDTPPEEDEENEAEVEEPEKDKPETEEEFTEVEFEGKQYKLPAELKDALLRQSDYTRKTQEVAEQRKEVEHVKEHLGLQAKLQQQFIGHYAQLQSLDNQLAQMQKVDWNALVDSDPVQAMKLDRQYREMQEYRNTVKSDLETQQQQALQQHQAWVAEQTAKGREQLVKDLPGWGAELANQIRTTGKEYGFDESELAGVTDPRMVKVLHDAMKYRMLQSHKPEVDKKVAKASPILKPTGKTNVSAEQHKQARSTLKKSGSMSDAARLLERML